MFYMEKNIKNKGGNREKKFKKFVHSNYSTCYLWGSIPLPTSADSEAVSFRWN